MPNGIMLISPVSNYKDRRISQPLGIASIASELRESGYDVSIIDWHYLANKHGLAKSLDMIEEDIERKKPFIIGCSYYDDTCIGSARIFCYAAEAGSHFILGGHAATVRHDSLAKYLFKLAKKADPSPKVAIVRGEGEKTAKELADALYCGRDFHDIKGVTFYDGRVVVVNPDRELADLNKLHPPALDLLPPVKEYHELYYPIEESRGCVFDCSFCSIRGMYPYHRLKDPENIRAEAKKGKALGMSRIDLVGELVLLDKERALEIADIMQGLGLEWRIDAHPSLILKRRDILPLLKERGLVYVETGIESATQSSLDVFNKHTTPRKNENALKILKQNEIKRHIDIITFQPYMDMKDLKKNIYLIKNHLTELYNSQNYPSNIASGWVPNAGTPLFERASKDGLLKKVNGSHKVIYKDGSVAKVKKSFDYFSRKYLEEFQRRDDEMNEILRREKEEGIDPVKIRKKHNRIAPLPYMVLILAYECSMDGVKAEKYIDSLTTATFEAIDVGDLDYDLYDTYRNIEKKVRREKRRKLGKIAKT